MNELGGIMQDLPSPLELLETTQTPDVLVWCIELLTHKARVHLGLVPGKETQDLDQAQLAIDAAAALADLLTGKVGSDVLGELLMHIADLRLSYLQAKGAP
jgi:hypothetical protein